MCLECFKLIKSFLLALFFFILLSCAIQHTPVPVGQVPYPPTPTASDSNYGHEVLNMLVKKYPLSTNDFYIEQTRRVVDKLTKVFQPNPYLNWNVYVLEGDDVVNAAATRGNYIFVWTGLLKAIKTEEELATVLSHEIAHVLAGHTKETPEEEVNRMLAVIIGVAVGQALAQQGGTAASFADLGQALTTETVKGVLVNPYQRELEKEADMIGVFLMADAGYDPEKALEFWEKVARDPKFQGPNIEFFSDHPSAEERYYKAIGL